MLREKIQTLLKMNLLSLFSHWEICVLSHLLYFLCLNPLSMWTFLFLKGEKLKDEMCCVCPLNLINWYSFPDIISAGVRDIFPNLLKSTEVLQTSVHFGPGWKWNVSPSLSRQVIFFSCRMFPSLGHLVLCTCCSETLQWGFFSGCGGPSQQILLLSLYQRAECGFNIDKKHLETKTDLLKVMKRRPQGIPLGAGKVDNSSFHPTKVQHSAYSQATL